MTVFKDSTNKLIVFYALAVFVLLFACTPEEINPGGGKEVMATAIKLNKNELTLEKGANEILTVSFAPSNVTDKTLTWVSSNKGVAEVTDGIVVALGAGSTDIIVKHGDLSDKCTVTVVISAKSITLNKESISFKALNQTKTLTATVDPVSTTEMIEWSSSNSNVATVSSEGVVTSIAPGTAEITVMCGTASAKCSVTVEIAATAISLSNNSLKLEVGGTETLTATIEPSNSTDKLEWSSSAEDIVSVKDGVVTAIAPGYAYVTAMAGNQTATCEVLVKVPLIAVDLGLSVRWGNVNIGADSVEGYGDYYAWGEVETKDNYSWSTYKWCNGTSNSLTKYNTSDNKTVLEPEDDVAHVKLGGGWRIPSDTEWKELIDKCTIEWTNENDVWGGTVWGIRVTSKTNGNSIFLPAAYSRGSSNLNYMGCYGDYWSSSLSTESPDQAMDVFFYSGVVERSIYMRCDGLSIRPVSE